MRKAKGAVKNLEWLSTGTICNRQQEGPLKEWDWPDESGASGCLRLKVLSVFFTATIK